MCRLSELSLLVLVVTFQLSYRLAPMWALSGRSSPEPKLLRPKHGRQGATPAPGLLVLGLHIPQGSSDSHRKDGPVPGFAFLGVSAFHAAAVLRSHATD